MFSFLLLVKIYSYPCRKGTCVETASAKHTLYAYLFKQFKGITLPNQDNCMDLFFLTRVWRKLLRIRAECSLSYRSITYHLLASQIQKFCRFQTQKSAFVKGRFTVFNFWCNILLRLRLTLCQNVIFTLYSTMFYCLLYSRLSSFAWYRLSYHFPMVYLLPLLHQLICSGKSCLYKLTIVVIFGC